MPGSYFSRTPLAIVDVETTGGSPVADRITEVAALLIDDGELTDAFVTLVNPGVPIPPDIQWLTGISDAMVRDAPRFEQIAFALHERLAGRTFIAHNARFDYGFLKNEFLRAQTTFSARTLCTARLSRLLDPHEKSHGLDALIARHGFNCSARHRARGDAEVLRELLVYLERAHSGEHIEAAVRRLLRTPSLPPKLPPDALETLPTAPGVYLFYGPSALPIYVGKSVNVRERVRAHFSSDHKSGRDLRLSQEIERVDYEETSGELGALLREVELVKTRLPAHNVQLRRRSRMVTWSLAPGAARPKVVTADDIDPMQMSDLYGVFGSRASARIALHEIARTHGLCAKTLGLERGRGSCFAFQLGRCRGACMGHESHATHAQRLADALDALKLPAWPFAGAVALVERHAQATHAAAHVFDRWCWLGSAKSEAEAHLLAQAKPQRLDLDVMRVLRRALDGAFGSTVRIVPLQASSDAAFEPA